MGMIPDPRQIGSGCGGGHPIMIPGKSGMGMGADPDPRQIGGGTPTPDPRQIGDGDGDRDRGFRALAKSDPNNGLGRVALRTRPLWPRPC